MAMSAGDAALDPPPSPGASLATRASRHPGLRSRSFSSTQAKRPYTRVVVDDEKYKEYMEVVQTKRARVVTRDDLLTIVAVQATIRHEAFLASKRNGRPKKTDYALACSQYTGRNYKVCANTWSAFVNTGDVEAASAGGPRGENATRFPRTNALRDDLRTWLYDRNLRRHRTVARDVVSFLVSRNVISIGDGDKARAAALRAVQRYLDDQGFSRGKRTGRVMYKQKPEVLLQRDRYVLRVLELRESRRFVYMDESYCHHHHKAHTDSLFDPTDARPVPKDQHKGRRYCFIGAIVSADPTVPEAARGDEQKAHFMADTLDIFEGRANRTGKPQTKDYHGMFDHDYFVGWMTKLLAVLVRRGIANAIIVMDNAKYHKKLPSEVPKSSSKKADLVEACRRWGVPFSDSDTRTILWDRLREPIKAHAKAIIVSMAEEAGHEVMFSPPHYSDLQPIEIVWANVKGAVGRAYTAETTFAEVRCRLESAFEALPPRTVQGCINSSMRRLEELHHYIQQEEEEEEQEEGDETGNEGEEGVGAGERDEVR